MGRSGEIIYDAIYQKLFTGMEKYLLISADLRRNIYEHSSVYDFNKGDILLMDHKDCNIVYYIVEGFCLSYYNKDGREFVVQFFSENNFCTSWHSFLSKQKSFVAVKAVEKTTVIGIKREQLEWLSNISTEFSIFMARIMEKHIIEIEEHNYRMRSLQARERIAYYMESHEIHCLMKHVPRYSIASYLNMTQETFSKIFSEMNKE